MKYFAPDYYNDFKCIADKCRHSCCIGWEIDIDCETAKMYKQIGGDFGKRLSDNIGESDGVFSFKLTEDERCPFLNANGLCDIITTLGDGALCQICDDHPRFYNDFSHRSEVGIGLCCEAAGMLILSKKEKTTIIEMDDDGDYYELDEEIKLRQEFIDIIHNRDKKVDERVSDLLTFTNTSFPAKNLEEWIDLFLSLERLDKLWDKKLLALKNATLDFSVCEKFEIAFEQLLVYFLFRHSGKMTENVRKYIRFCILGYYMIRNLCALNSELTLDYIVETARLYSSEIEYSEENMQTLFNL